MNKLFVVIVCLNLLSTLISMVKFRDIHENVRNKLINFDAL